MYSTFHNQPYLLYFQKSIHPSEWPYHRLCIGLWKPWVIFRCHRVLTLIFHFHHHFVFTALIHSGIWIAKSLIGDCSAMYFSIWPPVEVKSRRSITVSLNPINLFSFSLTLMLCWYCQRRRKKSLASYDKANKASIWSRRAKPYSIIHPYLT